MNEEIKKEEVQAQEQVQQIQAQPAAPEPRANKYWMLVLLLLAVVLGVAILVSSRRSNVAPYTNTVQNGQQVNPVYTEPETPTEETTVVDDSGKNPSTVNDEVLKEIEDIENSDVTSPFDGTQLDNL